MQRPPQSPRDNAYVENEACLRRGASHCLVGLESTLVDHADIDYDLVGLRKGIRRTDTGGGHDSDVGGTPNRAHHRNDIRVASDERDPDKTIRH
jgi:hypothetical protein